MKETEKRMQAYFGSFNENRLDDFFALFDPEVELTAPFNCHLRGLDEVKGYYRKLLEDYPVRDGKVVELLVSANRAAALIEFSATTKSGGSIAFRATDWFGFKDGKINTLDIFYDSESVAKIRDGLPKE